MLIRYVKIFIIIIFFSQTFRDIIVTGSFKNRWRTITVVISWKISCREIEIKSKKHVKEIAFVAKRKVQVYGEKMFKRYIQRKEKSSKKVWTCSVCSINFIIASQLKNHRRSYLYFCWHREESFELKGELRRIEEMYASKMSYPCNVCLHDTFRRCIIWENVRTIRVIYAMSVISASKQRKHKYIYLCINSCQSICDQDSDHVTFFLRAEMWKAKNVSINLKKTIKN